tara:strand:+ start:217 stop:462 length:246 start_codon:yes stop_codon:yes gene_type:complete
MRLGDLSGIAITFVVLAVTLGVGATILASIQAGQVASSTAFNATEEGLLSLTELADWLPTLATIVAAAVVIGVISFFYTRT